LTSDSVPRTEDVTREWTARSRRHVSQERAVGTTPVDGKTQPYGLPHGGASCVPAEPPGSIGVAGCAARTDARAAATVKARPGAQLAQCCA